MKYPFGNEEQVTDLFVRSISSFVDKITVDANSNSIAHKKGNGKKMVSLADADHAITLLSEYLPNRDH